MHTAMMFVPATLGLLFMSWLMYTVLKKKLPKKLPVSSYDIEEIFFTKNFHPLKGQNSVDTKQKRTKFMLKILALSSSCAVFYSLHPSYRFQSKLLLYSVHSFFSSGDGTTYEQTQLIF